MAVDDAMPMTLTLYDKKGNTIMCYMPDDPQWWITGFDPMIQDVKPKDLTVIGSIDMSSNPELWEAFFRKYGDGKHPEFCFDVDNKTVYYIGNCETSSHPESNKEKIEYSLIFRRCM